MRLSELDIITQYPTINVDTFDDGSGVITFDVFDSEQDQYILSGGYVMATQDNDNQCFVVNVFDADGYVVSETIVPFNFKEI